MQKLSVPPLKRPKLSQLNPEFAGIGKQLNKSHLVRKQTELQKQSMVGRVSFLRKEEDQAEKRVMKKQKQLQTLMTVISRRQADSLEKQERRRAKEEMTALQRQLNHRRRNQHKQSITNAFLSLYGENHQNANEMLRTSRKNQQLRKSFRNDLARDRSDKVKRRSHDKEEGRQKVTSYLKDKVDMFTSRYKRQISSEEEQTKRLHKEVSCFNQEEGQLRLRLQNSHSRIQALEQQIYKATIDSRVRVGGNPSFNWSYLSKQKLSIQTKEQSSNPDPKLDRLIQRQLSITDSQS